MMSLLISEVRYYLKAIIILLLVVKDHSRCKANVLGEEKQIYLHQVQLSKFLSHFTCMRILLVRYFGDSGFVLKRLVQET